MAKIIIVIFFLILSGCNKKSEIQTGTQSKDTSKAVAVDSDGSKAGIIFEGLYIYNLNTNSFMDCKNSDSVYWVKDGTKKLADMYKKILINPNVYGTVVATVKGELIDTDDETTKEKYPRTLFIKEVISVEKKNFQNTCVPYDFWALGNEPAWSLEISEKENLIEFNLLSEKKVYYFFYAEPTEDNGIITYISHNDIQRYRIEAAIKKEKCQDKMSDRVYDYSVEVTLSGGKKYEGCGIKGK
jgi:uncharacterized membrane protein